MSEETSYISFGPHCIILKNKMTIVGELCHMEENDYYTVEKAIYFKDVLPNAQTAAHAYKAALKEDELATSKNSKLPDLNIDLDDICFSFEIHL